MANTPDPVLRHGGRGLLECQRGSAGDARLKGTARASAGGVRAGGHASTVVPRRSTSVALRAAIVIVVIPGDAVGFSRRAGDWGRQGCLAAPWRVQRDAAVDSDGSFHLLCRLQYQTVQKLI
jgi:hypothetical protein